MDDRGVGKQAIALVVNEGHKIASVLPDGHRQEVSAQCAAIDAAAKRLTELCARGDGDSSEAHALAATTAEKLNRLRDVIRTALVDRVVEDFMDTQTPLKQFSDCVLKPSAGADKDAVFEDRAKKLSAFAVKAVNTAKMVAVGTTSGNKKIAEALLTYSEQVRK